MQAASSRKTAKGGTPKRPQQSYAQRHIAKLQRTSPASPKPFSGTDSSHLSEELSARGDKLMELLQRGGDISNIKIEEEQNESQIMKNEYLETQLMWFKKIDQIRNDLARIRQNCHQEQTVIRDCEKQITARRTKLVQLRQKLQTSEKSNKSILYEEYTEETEEMEDEICKMEREGKEQLDKAREERNKLTTMVSQISAEIERQERELSSLSDYESEPYNTSLSFLLQEEDRLAQLTNQIEQETRQWSSRALLLEDNRPIREEVHRKYLELYEKMFINRELDKLEQLLKLKQQEMIRLQQYEQRKARFRLKRSQIQRRETQLAQKQRVIDRLTEDIKDKSTILLNLYQYESQKR